MDGMMLLPPAPFRSGALLHAHIAGLTVGGYIMCSKKLMIIVFRFLPYRGFFVAPTA